MSIFNFFFKGKYRSKDASDEEQSLNDLLRSMERQHYVEVPVNFPHQVETAYDVIALMNNFKHIHHSLYVDKDGTQHYKTKLGFTPVTVYNKEIEKTKLRAELAEKEQTIKELTKQNEALSSLLIEREKKKEEQFNTKRANTLLMERYSNIMISREARLVIEGLSKLDAYIKEKAEEHDHQQYKPGQKVDFTNQAEVRKRLLLATSFQNSLRVELAHVSARLSDLKKLVHDFLKKRY
jgi:hypothetical protein